VNPNGLATTVHFEYGLTTAYGTSTPNQSAGAGTSAVAKQAAVSSLTPNTTYHFRVVATNSSGTTNGGDLTLTTPPPPPTATTVVASGVVYNAATLNGSVNPNGLATTVHFEYGVTTAYGSSTADQSAGAGTSEVPAQAGLSSLAPNTTYHFRVVGINSSGTTNGGDLTFTTPPPPPSATTLVASGVTFDSATLNGSVNPNGLSTTVHFEYGVTAAYGTSTAAQSVGAGTSSMPVHAVITNLSMNAVYHYRAVATNSNGTAYGVDQPFTTLDDPEVVGTWAERTVVRNLPAAVGGTVDIGTLTFTGGTGSIEAAVNASGPGWSVAKRYLIPIRYNLGNGSPPRTWLRVLHTHSTGPDGVNNFDLDINVSGATALLRLRTGGGGGGGATARIAIKTTGLQTFANSSATGSAAVPAETVAGNAVVEVTGKAGIGVVPAGNSVLDVNGGDTRGLRLRTRSTPGAPTTGKWNKGTMILDSAADLFICTAPGTPGTWKKVGAP
jgi:hypothetical protein